MRLLALLPAALCTAALVLSFLCLFAGSNTHFMPSYAIVTLNTSRIGHNFFNTSESTSSNPVIGFLQNLTHSIENEIEDEFGSFARDLGLHDFYTAYLLDYCEGYYTPGPVPNATLSRSSISLNVTECSNRTYGYSFDAQTYLQRQLNESGLSAINLEELGWPKAIDTSLKSLKSLALAAFVLYCIAIAFIGIALLLALASVFFDGALSAIFNVVADTWAFLLIGIASALVTAVAVEVRNVINDYGGYVGVSAYQGNKFLVLTWVATGLMLIASLLWCVTCASSWRLKRKEKWSEK